MYQSPTYFESGFSTSNLGKEVSMAYTSESLENFISSNEFKMVLYIADTEDGFEDDEDWADLCETMIRVNSENDSKFTMDFQMRYMEPFNGIDQNDEAATTDAFHTTLSLIKADLNDNYILAALSLKSLGLATNLPLIPEAAFNKHSYQGYKDEFAVVRLLAWAGYDINDADDRGMTALHYFQAYDINRYQIRERFNGSSNTAPMWMLQIKMGILLLSMQVAIQMWSDPTYGER